MNDDQNVVVSEHAVAQRKQRSYVIGFVLSLILTLTAYFFVSEAALPGKVLISVIAGLASIQFIVQVIFFLHLGRETKPRWNLLTFVFMLGVLFIVVFGSLWIMSNLNYHMTEHETTKYVQDEENIRPSEHH